jgi:hypothetical protein
LNIVVDMLDVDHVQKVQKDQKEVEVFHSHPQK